VTAERLRFDFSHPAKMAPEELSEVERIVNEAIARDWPMSFRELPTSEAFAEGALGAFGDIVIRAVVVRDEQGDREALRALSSPPESQSVPSFREAYC
jgi:alanyl-tRNA synthetase